MFPHLLFPPIVSRIVLWCGVPLDRVTAADYNQPSGDFTRNGRPGRKAEGKDMYSRREFATCAGRAALGLGLLPRLKSAGARSYAAEYPHMLVTHVANMVNGLAERWDRERSKLKTAADIEARNRLVRQKAVALMHGFPDRNELSPAVVNIFQRQGYRIETLMFQSRPNFWVPASLYVPSQGTGPFPGIISPCGHSANGRLYAAYQSLYLILVKSGFVVLAYDPIGQGERRQHWNPQTRQNDVPGPVTTEHFLAGQLLLLLGEDLTNYRIWDGMRAIDYLLTRPEVDGSRIGCAGQSGGGTFTLFISALDERIKCATVHQGGTSHRWPVRFRPESRLSTGDTEQHIFRSALHGIDLCDLHVAIAPRPLLATIEHYAAGFNQTAAHVRARYEQMGVPERFATEEATDPHGLTVKLRLATAAWFSRWFYKREGPSAEPEFQLEQPETLYCTPNGSLRHSQQGDTIFSLMLKKQAKLPPQRKIPANAADMEAYRREMQADIQALLHYRRFEQPLSVREIVVTPRKGYRIEKLEFLSEPGIYVPAWVYVPDGKRASDTAVLFMNDGGIRRDGMEFGALEALARKGHLVVAIEVRGTGDTQPSQSGDADTTLQYLLWEIDESLLGMRVQDVVRGVDYALSRPDVSKTNVRLIGKGRAALWGLYAAALDPRISAAVCEGGLLSYGHLASVDRYEYSADVFVIDVLKHFDLPQVAAAVADRKLAILSPVDHMRKPADLAVARRIYEPAEQVYRKTGGADAFRVLVGDPQLQPAEQYLRLL
jgi:cephalosporin-C deacetylase-like acetyl esterase